jgi:hypothetical protein
MKNMHSAPAISKITKQFQISLIFVGILKFNQNMAIFQYSEIFAEKVDISQKTAKDLKLIVNSCTI